jgi:outer membrane protein assembly factor BamB
MAMALSGLLASRAAAQNPSPQVQRLTEFGLAPTTESLSGYLGSLVPTAERRAQLEQLVAQMGDEDYTRREQASLLLMRQVAGVNEVLSRAVAGEDYEVRWRAKRVLDQTDRESRALLAAVLDVIQQRKLPGLCGPVLAALPLCKDDGLRTTLRRALTATASPNDAMLLREQLSASDPHARIAAILTLSAVAGPAADADALRLLSDSEELVQAAAARALADHGKREALAPLVKLLESAATPVRVEASRTLRAATGKHFGYTVYDQPEKRTAAVRQWQEWLAGEGSAAALAFPLRDSPIDLGRLLVCDHSQNLLIEFDTTGKKLWQQAVGVQPWACLGLPNGHRLVGCFNDRTVVEYDDRGEEVWRVGELPGGPTSIERLENGNTLIACTEGSQVVEIDPAKKVVWRASLDGRPVDARRLEDGRTLVTLQHGQKVVELDAAGKVAWEIAGVGMAFSAERLPSGNTLVCAIGMGQVREYDRSGNVVWAQGKFANPYTAQRLASGNTVVVDTTGVTEIDPQGTTVFRLEMPNLSRMWRY